MSLLFEEIPLSPKLEVCGENEVDIRNQRLRLRRNRLILVEKAGGIFFRSTIYSDNNQYLIVYFYN